MYKLTVVVLALVPVSVTAMAGDADVAVLKAGDIAQWSIVVAADAIPSEKYAAEEFQGLFEKVSGAKLDIVESPKGPTKNVFIGPSEAMKKSAVAIETDDLGEEGLRIRIERENLAIAGGRPRGTLYGVYEFFEKYFGVRFLTCDHTQLCDLPVPLEAGPR